MRKQIILALPLSAGAMVHSAQPDVLTVAVFDFESRNEAVRDLGPKVATFVNADLSVAPDIFIVERAKLEKYLSEQELGLSGTVSTDTAAKVGSLTGAFSRRKSRPSWRPKSSAWNPLSRRRHAGCRVEGNLFLGRNYKMRRCHCDGCFYCGRCRPGWPDPNQFRTLVRRLWN